MIGYAVLIGRGLLQIEIDDFCGSSTSLISLILEEKGVCDSISEWEGRLQPPPPLFRLRICCRSKLDKDSRGNGKDKIRFFNWM